MCTCLCSRWVVITLWAPLPKKTSVEFVWEITPPAMCLRAISRNNPGETVSLNVISKVTETYVHLHVHHQVSIFMSLTDYSHDL